LTARPKSGRRLPIEKENPSLPPMHSARFQAQKKTSLDLLDPETLVNGWAFLRNYWEKLVFRRHSGKRLHSAGQAKDSDHAQLTNAKFTSKSDDTTARKGRCRRS
jgi:hypothetical protein